MTIAIQFGSFFIYLAHVAAFKLKRAFKIEQNIRIAPKIVNRVIKHFL